MSGFLLSRVSHIGCAILYNLGQTNEMLESGNNDAHISYLSKSEYPNHIFLYLYGPIFDEVYVADVLTKLAFSDNKLSLIML